MSASRIAQLYAAADKARAANRADKAAEHLEAVLALDPRQPKALNTLGLRALTSGNAAAAVKLLTRATDAEPRAIELWLNRANAERVSGDSEAELRSLDAALALDPYAVVALLQKAMNLERQGQRAAAARDYQAVVSIVGTAQPPLALAAAIAHGREVIEAERRALGEALDHHLAESRATVSDNAARRFDLCVDMVLGRARVYPSTPTGLLYPGLPLIEFFERDAFPWLVQLEAATPIIQREFAALASGFVPYVDMPPGAPVNQWAVLNGSHDWSALFLWRDGVRDDANCARCPETAALLASLPMLDIPDRGPAAFFSLLKPGAHIPPHVGVTNIRSVIHLPLVVPENCGIRVGNQAREWRIGEALAFDDTIEHEAWNRSTQPRAVLIIDAWNPALDEDERTLLRALTRGMDAHMASR